MTTQFKTPQQIFDQVATHLLTQGRRSGIESFDEFGAEDFNCYYRAPDGAMCAVGCLIAPETYSEVYEGFSAHIACNQEHRSNDEHSTIASKALRRSLIAGGVNPDDEDTMILMNELQAIHDGGELGWSWKLRQLATSMNLSIDNISKG